MPRTIKKSLFRRYNSGEEKQVWTEIEAMGKGALSPENKREVLPVLTDLMIRVKYNIDILHENIRREGYYFNNKFPVKSPSKNFENQLVKLQFFYQQFNLHLPLSIMKFFEIVGEVNFTGHNLGEIDEHPYADPLVIYGLDELVEYIFQDKGFYKAAIEESLRDNYKIGLLVSIDAHHKIGEQGGEPYQIELLPYQALDSILLYEEKDITFIRYLRKTFKQCGFSKLNVNAMKDQSLVKRLKKGLKPI